MAAIRVLILNEDGSINHERMGDIDSVMMAVEAENLEFTLTPPPDYAQKWYWYNNQWNTQPA